MSKIFIFFIIIFFIVIGFITSNKNFNFIDCNNSENICFLNETRQKIEGYVVSEVIEKNNKMEFVFRKKSNQKGNLNILVSSYVKENLFYGDLVYVDCKLSFPKNYNSSSFDYVKYLQLKNIYSVCDLKNIEILEKKSKKNFYYYLLEIRYFLKNRMTEIYGDFYDGLIFGILFGGNYLNKNLSNLFSNAGISHITAVSGYNISIIVSILYFLFINIGINRFRAFYFILFFLIMFTFFTGATSSVIRASIMSICSLIAINFGRLSNGLGILFFTGFLMVLFKPLILIYDVGFQLSFLATFGIIFFKPILDKILFYIPNLLNIKESFSTTISAFIFTSPVIFINFNSFNLLSIIVNLLVLEYIPFLMLLGIISIFIPKLTCFFSILIMKYIIFICEVFT